MTTPSDGGHIWPHRDADPRIQAIITASGITPTNDSNRNIMVAMETLLGVSIHDYSIDDLWNLLKVQQGITYTGEPFTLPVIGTPTPQPSNFANVQLVTGFEGTDAAALPQEESNNTFTPTSIGNAQIDTAQFMFGAASALFDGAGDQGEYGGTTNYRVANNSFSLETFVRFNSLPTVGNAMVFFSKYEPSSPQRSYFFTIINIAGVYNLRFAYSTDGSALTLVNRAITTPSLNTWYHAACCRDTSDDLRIFWEGQQEGAAVDLTGVTMFASTARLRIGGLANVVPNSFLDGWMDEPRIIIGEGIYTEDFTVPTAAHPRS